jgi:hypothetical protein
MLASSYKNRRFYNQVDHNIVNDDDNSVHLFKLVIQNQASAAQKYNKILRRDIKIKKKIKQCQERRGTKSILTS